MPFSTTFLGEQPPTHPSVMGLLPGEASPPLEVHGLDLRDVRVLDPSSLGTGGSDDDPVHRPFVGVEGDQGRWRVGFWNLSFKEQGYPILGHLELLDPNSRFLEAFPMVRSDVNEAGAPLASPQGDSNLAGVEVEVKGRRTGPKESLPNVGDVSRDSLPKSGSMGSSE